MRTKLLLLMAFALMGWSNAWAAVGDEVYGYETNDGSGLYFTGVELSDGTAVIYHIRNITTETSITIPSKFYDIKGGRDINISQVGEGTYALGLYSNWEWTDCSSQITAITFSSGITTVAGKAFNSKTALTSVTLSNTITTIGESGFFKCTGLTSIWFPSTLTTIGDYAFKDCTGLTSITFDGSTPPIIGTHAFAITESPYYNSGCTVKIPDGATTAYYSESVSWELTQLGDNHKIHELTYPSITTAGWGTYYNTYGYIMPEDVEGYIIDWTYEGKANLVKIYDPGEEVCPNIALLWKSTTNLNTETWYTVEALSSGGNTATWPTYDNNGTTEWYTNLLNGTQTKQDITAYDGSYYYYKLANDSKNGLGWYFGVEGGGVFENGAHKAYLAVNQSAGARSFIGFGDGATAIESVNKNIEINDDAYYNLHGQRVDNPTKGLYIVNGKKVIIK